MTFPDEKLTTGPSIPKDTAPIHNPLSKESPIPQGISPIPKGVLQGLAIVGFVALIIAGILLAIYASRFVPTAAEGLSSAAVSFSQIFTPSKPSTLSVVPNLSTITATSTVSKETNAGHTSRNKTAPHKISSVAKTHSLAKKHTATKIFHPIQKAGKQTTSKYLIHGKRVALHGLPDLVTHISAVGYLTSTSTSSFVAAPTIPFGTRVAVKFTITNIGTNVAAPWSFSASIPTQVNYIFNSVAQQPLNPGDHIDYLLSFDHANMGTNQTISVTANPKHTITESNFTNNSAAESVTVLGN